ncbi:MAG TPA: hypothetical protein VF062_06730 [Candidatus Limnocylindrales bacterium]
MGATRQSMAGAALALATITVISGCASDKPEVAQPAPTFVTVTAPAPDGGTVSLKLQSYPVPPNSHPHDVAPAADGGVWFTAQRAGYLGHLDPATGNVTQVPLGTDSAPHGVIVGPDKAAWITDGGLNAIVRVDAATREVRKFPLPPDRPAAFLNTAAFDKAGILWFTGQGGVFGKLDPASGQMQVFDAPRGRGPYGITVTPSNQVYYSSLAGNHIARVDSAGGTATVLDPPTANQGSRRIWTDSTGRLWVSQWNSGQVAMYDPATKAWKEWPLPTKSAHAYAVHVDETDIVWLTDFTSNAMVRFDPKTETFMSVTFPGKDAEVRQILSRPGEIWAAASRLNQIYVVRTAG